MTSEMAKTHLLKELLATFLHYGTWIASAIIGLGLAAAMVGSRLHAGIPVAAYGMNIATAGLILLILIPTVRVLLMTVVFLSHRDYRFGTIAAFVLVIIALGFVAGLSKL